MDSSIWPYDVFKAGSPMPPKLGEVTVFVLSPFEPKDEFDQILQLIKDICKELSEVLNIQIHCERSDKIASPGIIHSEIWERIRNSDILIFDLTGQNGNVLIELGVAAAWREKKQVILIKEPFPGEPRLFNIAPARYIEYERTYTGYKNLKMQLKTAFARSLSALPFEETKEIDVELPVKIDFKKNRRPKELYIPSLTHQRIINEELEFGSLYIFPNSWASVGNLKARNVSVTCKMKFKEFLEGDCWIGVAVRAQALSPRYSYLTYLRPTGHVYCTIPQNDIGDYADKEVGQIENLDLKNDLITFQVKYDASGLDVKVGTARKSFSADEIEHEFGEGRIMIQTWRAQLVLKELNVDPC